MKKLRNLCIAIIALVGLSSSAFAQGTGTAPAIGSTHSYWVNSANGSTHDLGVGNEYLWYITKGDLTTANTSDFTIEKYDVADPAHNGSTAVVDLYRLKLTWLAASAGSTYYLHLVETGTNGCSNHKVEIIKPVSDFQLAIANVDETDLGTEVGNDLANCAPSVTPVLVGSDVKYNYGTTALYYKVDATNIDKANYDLEYNIAVVNGPTTISATYGTVAGNVYTQVGNLVADGNDNTQTISNTANSSTVYIKVELDNNQGDVTTYASSFEGLAAHNVSVSLVSGTQSAATATIGTGVRNQNISARPSTSGIGSN